MNGSTISPRTRVTMAAAENAAAVPLGRPASGKRKRDRPYMMMAMLGVLIAGASMGISNLTNGSSSDHFTATLKCPIPNPDESLQVPDAHSKTYYVMGAPCDSAATGELGALCRMLIMTELTCTWEGLDLGGQVVTKSLMHGQGYMEGDYSKAMVAAGYDWGQTAAGDNYLARWVETMSPASITGTWTLTQGTGALEGITGEAAITCEVPQQGDHVEVCRATGSYSLPK